MVSPEVVPPVPTIAKGTRQDLSEAAARAQATPVIDDDIASIVHDIRTPLSIILLEADLIESRLGPRVSPAVARGLERIVQNAAYIDRLVANVLDLASLEAGHLELRIERVDLSVILRDTVERAVGSIDRARLSIEIRDVLYVDADASRLERVVSNLIGNALKYSSSDAPITVRLDRRGAHACISVIDAGPGLTAEQASIIFDRYQRSSDGQHDGYGLGLHVCRRIVEAHRGRIGVTSTPGQGSRFFVELLAIPAAKPKPVG